VVDSRWSSNDWEKVVSAVRLGSNIASLGAQRRLAENTSSLSKTFERLSSGQRINRASDDAAGLAIADSLRADSRIFNQGVRNLSDGISLLNIADSAIENLSSIVVRLEELAEQAANGTYGATQRKALDAEAQALSKEYFRISKTTKFNGLDLLGGSLGQVNLQAGVGAESVLSADIGGAIGTGTFEIVDSVLTGNGLYDLQLADFNGDGIQDVVSANRFAGLTVKLGRGDGTFDTNVEYAVGSNPLSVEIADLNGDGVFDLISADSTSNTLSVLLGRGDGTFQATGSYQAGASPLSVKAGDFNGDGNVDLLSADYGSGTISILLGHGDGSFQARRSYVATGGPSSVETGDFNGDGILDVVSADGSGSSVSIFIGAGDGTFQAAVSYASGTNVTSLAVGDFNGDGIADIASGSYVPDNSVSLHFGNGDGTFQTRTSFSYDANVTSLREGDFNGDGFLDIAVSTSGAGNVGIHLGDGKGSYAFVASYVGVNVDRARSIQVADLNGDGVLDFVNADDNSGRMSVFLGSSKDGVAPLLSFSLSNLAEARQALPVLKRKREQLAAQRGQIGAFQSRIAVASNVLQVTSENFKAAESRIRDVDMAKESADLVRLNILQQAASSVLSQANQQPSLALRLLQA
jgi:flagellin-like hook-associated protein FlgL